MMEPLDNLITDDHGLMTDPHQLRILVHALVTRISEVSQSLDGEEIPMESGLLMMALVQFAFAAHQVVCEDQFETEEKTEEKKEYNPWQLFSQE